MDVETTLKDIISDIKFFIKDGISTLPVTIGGTMLIMGLFTSNYAMLFFLVGFLLAAPFLAFAINKLVGLTGTDLFNVAAADICLVSNPFTTMNSKGTLPETVIVSEWLAMILFFFGYMGFNAVQLLYKESDVTAESDASKVSTRKTQAFLSLLAILFVLGGVLLFRLQSNCESFTKSIITMIIGGLVCCIFLVGGMAWYYGLSLVGEGRLSDLFGIANRLLGKDATKNGPVACVPMP